MWMMGRKERKGWFLVVLAHIGSYPRSISLPYSPWTYTCHITGEDLGGPSGEAEASPKIRELMPQHWGAE